MLMWAASASRVSGSAREGNAYPEISSWSGSTSCTKLSFRELESCPAAGMKRGGEFISFPSPLAAFFKMQQCNVRGMGNEQVMGLLTSQASLEMCKRWRFLIHFPTQKKDTMVGYKNTALSKQKNSD